MVEKLNAIRVLIADKINEDGINELKEVAEVIVQTDITGDELINSIKDFDAIVVRSRTRITPEVIENASKLKIIARAGVGVDNVDVEAATEKGIMVVNAPESASVTVAELTIGLILSLARKISIADKSVKEGRWEKNKFMGMELAGKTLGIIGMGRIGTQVAIRCKAFAMNILVYDPYLPPNTASKMNVNVVDLESLLKNADIITIHVPLTSKTRHLISKDELNLMKENAFIINCARGGIINENDLYNALSEGKIGGAALDVFEKEPPKDSPLLELDNLVATPHIGASTEDAQRGAALIVAKEIKRFFKGEIPQNVINKPVRDTEFFQIVNFTSN
jgi:D-3-phosphoglycerate dehydrogenase